MNDLISRSALYEKASSLEAQALAYVGKLNEQDDGASTEWRVWSAILAERSAFKHDVFDAPSAQPQWIFCNKKYPEADERVLVDIGYYDCHVWDCMSNRGDDYFWEDDQGLHHNKYEVIAWMPLPEPYKKKE